MNKEIQNSIGANLDVSKTGEKKEPMKAKYGIIKSANLRLAKRGAEIGATTRTQEQLLDLYDIRTLTELQVYLEASKSQGVEWSNPNNGIYTLEKFEPADLLLPNEKRSFEEITQELEKLKKVLKADKQYTIREIAKALEMTDSQARSLMTRLISRELAVNVTGSKYQLVPKNKIK